PYGDRLSRGGSSTRCEPPQAIPAKMKRTRSTATSGRPGGERRRYGVLIGTPRAQVVPNITNDGSGRAHRVGAALDAPPGPGLYGSKLSRGCDDGRGRRGERARERALLQAEK